MQVEALVLIDDKSRISPTVAIGILSVTLTGATTALVTRAVEHSLWLKLSPREVKNRVAFPEIRNLAQWSVSPYQRLRYFFTGRSWLLKAGGLFLFGTAALNPVLLSGVNPNTDFTTSTKDVPRTADIWSGHLDIGNSQFRGNTPNDNPIMIAALASMSNLSAPASTVCQSPSCQVSATIASLQANCNFSTHSVKSSTGTTPICSKMNPSICVQMSGQNGESNFTTGIGDNRTCDVETCPGQWCTILGVWTTSGSSSDRRPDLNSVDCQVQYGNVSVSQTSGNRPEIVPDSFVKSVWNIDGAPQDNISPSPSGYSGQGLWWYCYLFASSPYEFETSLGGGTDPIIRRYPMASMLLNYGGESDPSVVAKTIEKNFEMSTLLAFARAPDSADLVITTTERVQSWGYDPTVLAVLCVPLLATFLGLIGRMKVGSDDDVVGYDPVEIARRGPVMRRRMDMGGEEEVLDYDSDGKDEMEVWSVKRGEEKRRVKFVVG